MVSQALFSISFQQQSGRLSTGFNELESSVVGNSRLSTMYYRVLSNPPALIEVRFTIFCNAISNEGGNCL